MENKNFKEKNIQFLFYASSYYFCLENDIGLFPEVNFGRGPVDFCFGEKADKIVVEVKLSTNKNYRDGLKNQLPTYMDSSRAIFGYFLFMNYDGPTTEKIEKLFKIYNKMPESYKNNIEIISIDSFPLPSASKIRD